MTLDYYAYRKKSMDDTVLARQEPHLAYLWHEAVNPEKKNRVCDSWQKTSFDSCQIPESFVSTLDSSTVEWLPRFSFMLRLPFELDKPYLSKDEKSFYLLDNPLRREKVFKIPMIAASSWKGALRAAMVQLLVQWWTGLEASEKEERSNRKRFISWRIQLVRLFGTERGTNLDDKKYNHYLDKLGGEYQGRWFRRWLRRFISPSGFLAGRLHFYPTFFEKVALEVINPHNRKTGTNMRGPILFECVPGGAEGVLSILYVPFGKSEKTYQEVVAQDLVLLAEGIRAMLTIYGFGAKTSSGFGVVKESLTSEGRLLLKAALPSKVENNSALQQPKVLPRYLEAHDQLTEITFSTLDEFCSLVREAAAALCEGGAA